MQHEYTIKDTLISLNNTLQGFDPNILGKYPHLLSTQQAKTQIKNADYSLIQTEKLTHLNVFNVLFDVENVKYNVLSYYLRIDPMPQ